MNKTPEKMEKGIFFHRGIMLSKRVFDLAFSILAIIFTIPIAVLISVAIWWDDGFPILYSQDRLGRNQKPFCMIKFRTMTHDAHPQLQEILETDDLARADYDKHHKLTNDPRLTRVGKFIRKFGMDELPQIVNILRGEMSWVGPRAYLPEELVKINPGAFKIFTATPGLTGWWQVNGRNKLTFEQRIQMDEYYIEHLSPALDLRILFKTIFVILQGSGM